MGQLPQNVSGSSLHSVLLVSMKDLYVSEGGRMIMLHTECVLRPGPWLAREKYVSMTRIVPAGALRERGGYR
jgi:hypothetical protein